MGKSLKREPTPTEKRIAEYLRDKICGIPGCPDKIHYEDAMAITDIILDGKDAKR